MLFVALKLVDGANTTVAVLNTTAAVVATTTAGGNNSNAVVNTTTAGGNNSNAVVNTTTAGGNNSNAVVNTTKAVVAPAATTTTAAVVAPASTNTTAAGVSNATTAVVSSTDCILPTTAGYNTAGSTGALTMASWAAPTGIECDTAAGYSGTVTTTVCSTVATAFTVAGCTMTSTTAIAGKEVEVVQTTLKIDNVDFAAMDASTKAALADAIREAAKASVPAGCEVQVELSAGSVVALISVTPPSGTSLADVTSQLTTNQEQLTKDTVENVKKVDGIDTFVSGTISAAVTVAPAVATVQIAVASTTGSVGNRTETTLEADSTASFGRRVSLDGQKFIFASVLLVVAAY